ncbi:MAG TPA: LPS assembly lipoprotein LptE [Burkholderiaceae bacterium]|nr:LPS assembly lipoprotein LptE [Burkholderiaceae bacterium]
MDRRALLAGAAAATLSGCGFTLRGAQALPVETLFLALPVNSPLGAEITRVVRSSTNARVVTDRKEAQAIFELLGESREREVLSVNAQGRAREYQLRLLTTFRVVDPNGIELIAPTTLTARRDIAFNESELLAKESEEALLYRDMQSDLVRQMVTRLQGMRFDASSR